MAITAKDIWQRAKHLPKVPIEGAATLEGVYVRGMSIEEAADWDDWAGKHGGREIARRILLDFCVNEDDEQVFTEEDVPRFRQYLSSELLPAVMIAFEKVNALAQERMEELAKNLNGRRKSSSSRSRRT